MENCTFKSLGSRAPGWYGEDRLKRSRCPACSVSVLILLAGVSSPRGGVFQLRYLVHVFRNTVAVIIVVYSVE